MMEIFSNFIDPGNIFPDQSYALEPGLFWPHAIGDGLIAISFMIISILVVHFIVERQHFKFMGLYRVFALFIFACGLTHALSVLAVWQPVYALGAVVKLLTGVVSVGAVLFFLIRLGDIRKIPSPIQLSHTNALLSREINQRQLAEETVRKLNQELESRVKSRTEQLEEVNRELEFYTQMVSHDLKSPIRHMEIIVEMIEESESLTKDGAEALEVMRHGLSNMQGTIDSLLSVARVNQTEMEEAEVKLANLFESSFTKEKAARPNHHIEVRMGDLPTMRGDEKLLYEVVRNLVSNAVKYSSKKERSVIEVLYEPGDRQFCIHVKDNGAGFPKGKEEEIFEKFKRAHRTEEFEGTGIGLAVVKRIIERHGGRVSAHTSEAGATFTLCFGNERLTA